MLPAGFEPAIPASERLHSRSLDCAAGVEYYKSFYVQAKGVVSLCKTAHCSKTTNTWYKYTVYGSSEIMP